jgi:hypothetical protein
MNDLNSSAPAIDSPSAAVIVFEKLQEVRASARANAGSFLAGRYNIGRGELEVAYDRLGDDVRLWSFYTHILWKTLHEAGITLFCAGNTQEGEVLVLRRPKCDYGVRFSLQRSQPCHVDVIYGQTVS